MAFRLSVTADSLHDPVGLDAFDPGSRILLCLDVFATLKCAQLLALSHRIDVAHGRHAEVPAVLATELTNALIAHLIASGGCVDAVHQHALPRSLKANLL